MTNSAQETRRDGAAVDLWSLRIPKVKISHATLEAAARHALEVFHAAHPTEKGLKGIVVSAPENADIRVTVDLSDVPVGLAFKYIADAALCVVREREGIVTLSPLSVDGNKRAVYALEPSAKVMSALELGATTNSTKLTASLSHMGVNATLITRAEYTVSRNLLLFEGPDREIAILRSVFELIERGALIEVKKQP